MNLHEWIARKVDETEAEGRATLIDPAPILRRCEADRRILDRHAAVGPDCPECAGCGTTYDDWPATDNINDCPELLDLAHAHGISDATLASLARPEHPPEPVMSFTEALADAFRRVGATPAREVPDTFRPAPRKGPITVPITDSLAEQRFNPWH